MWSFRAYLTDKCADPKFLQLYQDQCTICPKTVVIITTIRERGLSFEDVARRSGVALEHLELLESADRCSYDDVKQLSRFLGLADPGVCRKKSGNRDRQL
jgi:cyanate lyase